MTLLLMFVSLEEASAENGPHWTRLPHASGRLSSTSTNIPIKTFVSKYIEPEVGLPREFRCRVDLECASLDW